MLGPARSPSQRWRGTPMYHNVQLLRAVAAFMVFCYHALPQYKAMGGASDVFARFAAVGFAGVDVFFVISGFVAALTTLDKERTAANAMQFLKRRVLRIYLGYWPFFGLALLVFWQSGFALSALDLLGSFFLASVDMPRLLLYVSWSLTYELIFYGLVAATFAFPARSVAVLTHVAFLLLGGALLSKWGEPLSPTFIFLGFLVEFLAGALLYIHRDVLRKRWWLVAGSVAVFLAYWCGASRMATDGTIRIATFGAGALFLVMLAIVLEQSRTWIAPRFAAGLGDASYTLYLLHLVLLVIFAGHVRDALTVNPYLREAGFFVFLAVGVALSRLLYLRLELPLYRWSIGAARPAKA